MADSKDFAVSGALEAVNAVADALGKQNIPLKLDLIFDDSKLQAALDAMMDKLARNFNARLQAIAQQFDQRAAEWPLKGGKPYNPATGQYVSPTAPPPPTGAAANSAIPKFDITVEVPGFDKLVELMQAQARTLEIIKTNQGKRGSSTTSDTEPTAPVGGGRAKTPPPPSAEPPVVDTVRRSAVTAERAERTAARIQAVADKLQDQVVNATNTGDLLRALQTLIRAISLASGPDTGATLRKHTEDSGLIAAVKSGGASRPEAVDALESLIQRALPLLRKVTAESIAEMRAARAASVPPRPAPAPAPAQPEQKAAAAELKGAAEKLGRTAGDLRDAIKTPASDFDWAGLFRNLTTFSTTLAGAVSVLHKGMGGLDPATVARLNQNNRDTQALDAVARARGPVEAQTLLMAQGRGIPPLQFDADASSAQVRAAGFAPVFTFERLNREVARAAAKGNVGITAPFRTGAQSYREYILAVANAARARQEQFLAENPGLPADHPAMRALIDFTPLDQALSSSDPRVQAGFSNALRRGARKLRRIDSQLKSNELSRLQTQLAREEAEQQFRDKNPGLTRVFAQATPDQIPLPLTGDIVLPIARGGQVETLTLSNLANTSQSTLQRQLANVRRARQKLYQTDAGLAKIPVSWERQDLVGRMTAEFAGTLDPTTAPGLANFIKREDLSLGKNEPGLGFSPELLEVLPRLFPVGFRGVDLTRTKPEEVTEILREEIDKRDLTPERFSEARSYLQDRLKANPSIRLARGLNLLNTIEPNLLTQQRIALGQVQPIPEGLNQGAAVDFLGWLRRFQGLGSVESSSRVYAGVLGRRVNTRGGTNLAAFQKFKTRAENANAEREGTRVLLEQSINNKRFSQIISAEDLQNPQRVEEAIGRLQNGLLPSPVPNLPLGTTPDDAFQLKNNLGRAVALSGRLTKNRRALDLNKNPEQMGDLRATAVRLEQEFQAAFGALETVPGIYEKPADIAAFDPAAARAARDTLAPMFVKQMTARDVMQRDQFLRRREQELMALIGQDNAANRALPIEQNNTTTEAVLARLGINKPTTTLIEGREVAWVERQPFTDALERLDPARKALGRTLQGTPKALLDAVMRGAITPAMQTRYGSQEIGRVQSGLDEVLQQAGAAYDQSPLLQAFNQGQRPDTIANALSFTQNQTRAIRALLDRVKQSAEPRDALSMEKRELRAGWSSALKGGNGLMLLNPDSMPKTRVRKLERQGYTFEPYADEDLAAFYRYIAAIQETMDDAPMLVDGKPFTFGRLSVRERDRLKGLLQRAEMWRGQGGEFLKDGATEFPELAGLFRDPYAAQYKINERATQLTSYMAPAADKTGIDRFATAPEERQRARLKAAEARVALAQNAILVAEREYAEKAQAGTPAQLAAKSEEIEAAARAAGFTGPLFAAPEMRTKAQLERAAQIASDRSTSGAQPSVFERLQVNPAIGATLGATLEPQLLEYITLRKAADATKTAQLEVERRRREAEIEGQALAALYTPALPTIRTRRKASGVYSTNPQVRAVEEQLQALKDAGPQAVGGAGGAGGGNPPPPPNTPPAAGGPTPPNGDEWSKFAAAMRELAAVAPMLRDMTVAVNAFSAAFSKPADRLAFSLAARKDYLQEKSALELKLDAARTENRKDIIRTRSDEKLRLRDAFTVPLADLPTVGQAGLSSLLPQQVIVKETREALNALVSANLSQASDRNALESGIANPRQQRQLLRSLRQSVLSAEGASSNLVDMLGAGAAADGDGRIRRAFRDLAQPQAALGQLNRELRPLYALSAGQRDADVELKTLRARGAKPEAQAAAEAKATAAAAAVTAAGFKSVDDLDKAIIGKQTQRQAAISQIATGFRAVEQAIKQAAQPGPIESFTSKLKALSMYTGAGFFVYGAVQQIRSSLSEVVRLEAEVTRVQGILGETGRASGTRIQNTVLTAASDYGVTTSEALQQYKLIAQSGVGGGTAAATERFTRASLLGSQAAQLDPQQSSELLLAVNAQSRGRVNPFDILDRISEVERRNAVTSQDLALGIQRVGAVATQFQSRPIGGMDQFDLINGLQTAIVEQTRVGGNQAATSLRFMLARLGSSRVTSQLQDDFGIKLGGNSPDEFRPLMDIMSDIAARYQELKKEDGGQGIKAAQLLTTFAGARQLAAATAIFDNWSKVMEVAGQSAASFGDAMRRLTLQQNTMEFQLKQLGVQWLTFTNNLLKESGLLTAAKSVTRAVTTLPVQGLGGAGSLLTAGGVVLGGQLGAGALASRLPGTVGAGFGAIAGSTLLGGLGAGLVTAAVAAGLATAFEKVNIRDSAFGQTFGLRSTAQQAGTTALENFNRLDQVREFDNKATAAGLTRRELLTQVIGASLTAQEVVLAQVGKPGTAAGLAALAPEQQAQMTDRFNDALVKALGTLPETLKLSTDPDERLNQVLALLSDAIKLDRGFGQVAAETLRPQLDDYTTEILNGVSTERRASLLRPEFRTNGASAGDQFVGRLAQTLAELRNPQARAFASELFLTGNKTVQEQLTALATRGLAPSTDPVVNGYLERANAVLGPSARSAGAQERYFENLRAGFGRLSPAQQNEVEQRGIAQFALRAEVERTLASKFNLDFTAGQGDTAQADAFKLIRDQFERVTADGLARLAKRTDLAPSEKAERTATAEAFLRELRGPQYRNAIMGAIKEDEAKSVRGLVRDQIVDVVANFASASNEIGRFAQLMRGANLGFDALTEQANTLRTFLRNLGGVEGGLIRQLSLNDRQLEQLGLNKGGTLPTGELDENFNALNLTAEQQLRANLSEEQQSAIATIQQRRKAILGQLEAVRGDADVRGMLPPETIALLNEAIARGGPGNDTITLGTLRDMEQATVTVLRAVESGLLRRDQVLALPQQQAQFQQLVNSLEGTSAQNALTQQTRVLEAQGRTTVQLGQLLRGLQQQTDRRVLGADLARDAADQQARLLFTQGRSSDFQRDATVRSNAIEFNQTRVQTLGEQLVAAEQALAEERLRQRLGREAVATRLVGAAGAGLSGALSDPGLFGRGAIGTTLLQPLASALQTTLAEAFTQNLIGPEGILGQQLRGLFDEQQLFQTRDLIVDGHTKGAAVLVQQLNKAFAAAAEQLRQALQLAPQATFSTVQVPRASLGIRTPRVDTPTANVTMGALTMVPTASGDQFSAMTPEAQAAFGSLMDRYAKAGVRAKVVETLRSQARQNALYEQGRSTTGPVVTWTRDSMHTKGLAADIYPTDDAGRMVMGRSGVKQVQVGGQLMSEQAAWLRMRGVTRQDPRFRLLDQDFPHVELRGTSGGAVAQPAAALGTTLPPMPGVSVLLQNGMLPDMTTLAGDPRRLVTQGAAFAQVDAQQQALFMQKQQRFGNAYYQLGMQGATLVGSMAGARLAGRDRNPAGAQIGSTFGSTAGQLAGQQLVERAASGAIGGTLGSAAGSAVGSVLFPVVGTLLGGLLGGAIGNLFSRRKPEDPDASPLQRIERNTRETVTAIENPSRLLELQDRFLNVPASFTVPRYRPMDVGGGSTTTYQAGAITITVQGGADPQTTADAVYRRLQLEMTTSIPMPGLRG